MTFSLKMTAAVAVMSCLAPTFSLAQVSPDIQKLLTTASEQDGGKNLDLVAKLAIAANPGAAQDIQAFIAGLKQQKPVEVVTAIPDPGYFSFKGWDGSVDLNYLRSSGNTRQESLGLAGKIHRDSGLFHHTLASFLDLNKNTGVKDKQRWGISYKLDYDFSEKLYVTSFAGYENDQFGAFRERITTSLGIGYPVIETDSYSWKVEAGPGILFTRDLPGEAYNTSISAFASSIFDWTINDRSDFTNITKVYFGNKNVIDSKTALKVKINGALSSKLSYDIMYDRDAPVGRKKTDTVARAGLSYDF